MSRKIIAVVGLPGSGKTEVIQYLEKELAWPKVYFGDVTFDELKKQGLEINEKNERAAREGLRKKFGDDIYAKRIIEKIEKIGRGENVLVESLYSWVEYLCFKKEFGDDFKVLAVHASPEIRYQRLAARPVRPLSKEEAKNRDYAQIENLTQANPIALADFMIVNEGTKADLFKNLMGVLRRLNAQSKEE